MSVESFKNENGVGGEISWWDGKEHHPTQIPQECVDAIAQSGSNDSAVEEWQTKLDFLVPREIAIKDLLEYGAWDLEELEQLSDIELAQKILWIKVWDIAESE